MAPRWLTDHLAARRKLLTHKKDLQPWDDMSAGGLAEVLAIEQLIERMERRYDGRRNRITRHSAAPGDRVAADR
jgi:hypothetical protein